MNKNLSVLLSSSDDNNILQTKFFFPYRISFCTNLNLLTRYEVHAKWFSLLKEVFQLIIDNNLRFFISYLVIYSLFIILCSSYVFHQVGSQSVTS